MSRKEKRKHAQIVRLRKSLDAEVQRANQQAAMHTRLEVEFRVTMREADATIQKLTKARVGVYRRHDRPDIACLEIGVGHIELAIDPEGLCGHIARSAADQIMTYAIENKIVSECRVAPLVDGPKRRDILDDMRYPYDRPLISTTGS